jgi:4'-phosphopantetheinyl transferase
MRIDFLRIDEGGRDLGLDELHLWCAPLDRAIDPSLLTADELARAERFKMRRVREQFVAARGQLRIVLGRYLNLAPAAVNLTIEASGKPVLHSCHGSGLHFNVSHSESLAIYAVTRRGRVGVDVELRRTIPDAESLVERFFSPRERDQFVALPPIERPEAFFRAWTRKEAVLKALGRGVQALDECDVTFCASEDERVLRVGSDCQCSAKWLLKSWEPTPDYVAAVAVELN